MKPYIKLVLVRADGHRSEGVIKGADVGAAMLDAAEDLVYAMDFGSRPEVEYLTMAEIEALETKHRRWLTRGEKKPARWLTRGKLVTDDGREAQTMNVTPLCQYCDKPRTHQGYFGKAPVSLCENHRQQHGHDFDRVEDVLPSSRIANTVRDPGRRSQ